MSFVPPSDVELEAIARIKEILDKECEVPTSPNTFRDTVLIRFLRGRKHNEKDAIALLLRYAHWRHTHNVDNAIENTDAFDHELVKNKFIIYHGENAERPINFVYVHRHNKNDRNLDAIKYLIIHVLESLIARANPLEEKMILCLDMSKFGLSNMGMGITCLQQLYCK
jgi:hypothetical protein